MTATPQHTPLYAEHLAAGGKIVDFAGWALPIHYGSQLKEHETVRADAGMFDVSHMTVIDLTGTDSPAYLQRLITNDVRKLGFVGKALYAGMLNAAGGVVDDLIVYLTDWGYRVVVNAATREKDLAWMRQVAADFAVTLTVRDDLSMLAIQGPHARAKVAAARPALADTINSLKVFQGLPVGAWFVARTGYTGEDGLEIMLPDADAPAFWRDLVAAGVAPTGLGARDTLRLEAGMNLYGNDMNDETSPLQAGMGWTVDLKDEARDFVGKAALVALKEQGVDVKQVGLLLEKGGILRDGMEVITETGNGITTSGVFSPSLKQSIAIARVPKTFEGDAAKVLLRGKEVDVRVLKLPFVRNGQKQFD